MIASYVKKNWVTIIGVVIGAAGGFLYWRFVGCSSGTCPITSSPVISSVWGAVLGGLLFSSKCCTGSCSSDSDKTKGVYKDMVKPYNSNNKK